MQDQFSYADAGDPLIKRFVIRAIERAVGQPRLKRLYADVLADPLAAESFFKALVQGLALDLRYDRARLAHIPRSGPLVIVANHPFGALDGIVLSRLVEEVRRDFIVLTNAVLLRASEVRRFALPVDFSGTRDATRVNLATRAKARAHLAAGGAIIVFPSGTVATSPDFLGLRPAVEVPWQPFAAQLVRHGRAAVVPVYFPGQNSWTFQVASHVSMTLRMALLFREVRRRIGTPLPIEIGDPIPYSELARLKDRQALVDHLRRATYSLADREKRLGASAAAAIGSDALIRDPSTLW